MSDITKYLNSRIKNIILIDKKDNPKKILKVIKSEIINVIGNYMQVSDDNVCMDIIINRDGFYELRLRAISNKIKVVNSFTE